MQFKKVFSGVCCKSYCNPFWQELFQIYYVRKLTIIRCGVTKLITISHGNTQVLCS
uniref:Uncharacterized protein MANES_07G043600 n=1 Tax=Rhizophora mucronata TaxID=61149 RepID=A0A2P2QWH0_RHIMU